MSVNDVLVDIGVRLHDLVAGAAGGLVRAIMLKRSDEPWRVSDIPNVGTSVLVGMLTSVYLAEPIGRFFGANTGLAGFVVGLAGMALCQKVAEEVVKRWRPGKP